MTETTKTDRAAPLIGGDWTDPLEDGVRSRVRDFIEAILEEELEAALGRGRYERKSAGAKGYRNGHRDREIVGTFGPETVRVPRARVAGADGRSREWRSRALPRYRRLTRKAEALIAGAYLAGTNTRRVKRALSTLFAGAVGKDVVGRAWRKVKTDWEAWNTRDLGDEDIVRLILDGTVVKARIDKKATAIPILVAVGVRRDGQKVLIGLKNMGGETAAAWRAFLQDLSARGLREPGFVIVDGAPGLEAALAELWPEAPVQRCTVHVWMPPLMQGFSERFEHVIECGHVPGLMVRRCSWPRAGMAMRGSGPNHKHELWCSLNGTGFPDPDLVDPVPLLFVDLLTSPTHRGLTA